MRETTDLIGNRGSTRMCEGNSPVLADRADKVWVVERGHVDVFSVRLRDGCPEGARHPLFSVPRGDILLGAKDTAKGRDLGLLAAGAFGTMLREMDTETFLRQGIDPSMTDDIQRLLRRWIRNASLAVGKHEIIPKGSKDLEGKGRLTVEKGGTVHAAFKTVWIQLDSGRAAFMGREDFPGVPLKEPFPLIRGAWLGVSDDAVLSFQEEWPSPGNGELLKALKAFSGYILDCAAANVSREAAAGQERMACREEAQRSMLKRALSRLTVILNPPRLQIAPEIDKREPLLAACRMVGQASGIKVQTPRSGSLKAKTAESLDEICRASAFRSRQVALRGDWWKRDSGPLLVFHEADQRPLAAIPSARRRYKLLDPVEGTARSIDRKTADSLTGQAYVFYRPFPNTPLRGMDLLRLGIRGCARDIGTAFFVGLCGALLGLLVPGMTALLFDTIIPGAQGAQLVQLASLLVAGALATFMFDMTRGIAVLRAGGRMDNSMQAALWDRLLSLPAAFFRAYTAGDLAERSMGISAIRLTLSGIVVNTVMGGLFTLINLGVVFHYSPRMSWIAIALFAAGLAFILCVSILLVRRERRIVELDGRNQGIILQLITGIAKLRISNSENSAFSLWADSFAQKKRHSFQAGKLRAALTTFGAVFPILTLMSVFLWLIRGLDGELSPGGFLAFSAAFLTMQNAMLQIGSVIPLAMGIFPIYNRLKPIVKTVPEADETKEKPGTLNGRIDVNHVSYRYDPDSPLVLKDVSISVAPGEFVAIVGNSGSGKSTLLRLLLGFASPEEGAVYYDRRDLAALDVRAVRRQIGVVLQNAQIMNGDIRSTILGSSKLTLDDAWEAARMAGLEKDIEEMPMGMYTVLPAGGGTLSGGQRQRLIIARAIVRKPRMLFFDEATSALDNKTQEVVSQSLKGLAVSRIVIAHRLSTIVNADRIYVLEKGEVAEQGTYEELMELDGLFASMSRRQIA
ncbi:MAG: NHLP bacteriocin export ABC transporter permease/ATPase subunit [Deltaproteobacteria bacterium]|nr:NHLP bacteriocin export ABC transporter permease/ATPase subunit [Deltaproteobacteria bacterium]